MKDLFPQLLGRVLPALGCQLSVGLPLDQREPPSRAALSIDWTAHSGTGQASQYDTKGPLASRMSMSWLRPQ
jgi:hypothetical protein